MHKPKSNSFHGGEPKSCEVENASLKMRNLLLEDAITKMARNPSDHRHSRNQSVNTSAKSQLLDIPSIPQPSNAELLAKLYNSNRALEGSIMKLNSASEELKIKDEELLNSKVEVRTHKKAFSDLKELVTALKQQNKQLNDRQEHQSQKHLQSKLQQTIQYNEQLFTDYQKILRQNQSHQCQILEQQEQIVQLKESLRDNELALQKALAKAENKVQNLEQDLDRLELKQNQSIPELNKRVKALHNSQQQNFEILECCQEYINSQFVNSINTLRKHVQAYNSNSLRQFSMKTIQFRGLQELVLMSNDKGVHFLIQKMNISQLLQTWMENLFSYIMIFVRDKVIKPIQDKISHTERKMQMMEHIVQKLINRLSESNVKNYFIKRFRKQSISSSFVNYSTIAQSQIGHSVRKSSFLLDKENQYNHNKSSFCSFEDNFEKKLIDVLDNSLSKISQNSEGLHKSFKKFKKLLQSPSNMAEDTKKLYDSISQQAENNDLLTMYLKKEITTLKQDLSTFMKSQRSSQLPKNM